MSYVLEDTRKKVGDEKTLELARSRAFEIVMKNKKADIFIRNGYTRRLSGLVFYSKIKDEYGRVPGPVYVSFKNDKDYLLDHNGKIYDVVKGKRIPGKYTRKKTR